MMDWDHPARSRWFAGAAATLLVAGFLALRTRGTPELSPGPAPAVGQDELRDAVASPPLPAGGIGWLQGAGALMRAARNVPLSSPKAAAAPLRLTSGRAVFSGRRAIVEHVRPGGPEPTLDGRP